MCCLDINNVRNKNEMLSVWNFQMTNSTIWAAGSREALRTTCMKELSQNTTLKEVTEEGKPSIAE